MLICLALMLLVSCSGDPARTAWHGELATAHRDGAAGGPLVARYDSLAASARTPADGCLARVQALAAAVKAAPDQVLERASALLADAACADQHPEARYRLVEQAGGWERAVAHTEELLRSAPSSYWARQALEHLWRLRSEGGEGSLHDLCVAWYEQDKESPLSGFFLTWAARDLLSGWDSSRGADSVARRGLRLLLMVVEHHGDSALWDDAVWRAADLLEALGHRGDESRLLEEALLPRPGRGTDTLVGAFAGRVRLRLAGLYERQGRYEEALRELRLVVNVHGQRSAKDDALWSMARIYATLGERDEERRALAFLLEHCPWSRHAAAAQQRLSAP